MSNTCKNSQITNQHQIVTKQHQTKTKFTQIFLIFTKKKKKFTFAIRVKVKSQINVKSFFKYAKLPPKEDKLYKFKQIYIKCIFYFFYL